jgi:hypothetical protein
MEFLEGSICFIPESQLQSCLEELDAIPWENSISRALRTIIAHELQSRLLPRTIDGAVQRFDENDSG